VQTASGFCHYIVFPQIRQKTPAARSETPFYADIEMHNKDQKSAFFIVDIS